MASGLAGCGPFSLAVPPVFPGSPSPVWLLFHVGGQVSWGRATWEVIPGHLPAGKIIKEKWVLDHLLVFPLNPVRFHFTKWFSNPICDMPVSCR